MKKGHQVESSAVPDNFSKTKERVVGESVLAIPKLHDRVTNRFAWITQSTKQLGSQFIYHLLHLRVFIIEHHEGRVVQFLKATEKKKIV